MRNVFSTTVCVRIAKESDGLNTAEHNKLSSKHER
jgi:hypothetical protein